MTMMMTMVIMTMVMMMTMMTTMMTMMMREILLPWCWHWSFTNQPPTCRWYVSFRRFLQRRDRLNMSGLSKLKKANMISFPFSGGAAGCCWHGKDGLMRLMLIKGFKGWILFSFFLMIFDERIIFWTKCSSVFLNFGKGLVFYGLWRTSFQGTMVLAPFVMTRWVPVNTSFNYKGFPIAIFDCRVRAAKCLNWWLYCTPPSVNYVNFNICMEHHHFLKGKLSN